MRFIIPQSTLPNSILNSSYLYSPIQHHPNVHRYIPIRLINYRTSPTLLLSFPISFPFQRSKSTMVTATSSNLSGGAFTTLSQRVLFDKEIKKSKFIAVAAPIFNEQSAQSFLSLVRDNRATHNCWAYKIGDQFRSNDDGEPSGTAGKPILSAIESSGIDRIMVVVIRHFGGIKLGTGGLVRAYGGVTSECLKNAPTCLVKSKVPMGVEVSFDLLGLLYHQLQSFQAEDVKQDYDTGKDGTTMVTFKVDFDKAENLEDAIKGSCGRNLVFFRH